MKKREIRSLKATELRAVKGDDGKTWLTGRAASYGVLSSRFWGGWYERIVAGAFKRAVNEKQDVRHLINHDPTLVLGRTQSKTTELTEDDKGLAFRTLLPNTDYAANLAELVDRGDVNECSFQFLPVNTAWVEEPDPDNAKDTIYVRELRDVDLFDISTVTFPAYPGTSTELQERSLPADLPADVRTRLNLRSESDACECDCPECVDGNCAGCSNEDCSDENCRCADMRAARAATAWKSRAEMRLKLAQSQE